MEESLNSFLNEWGIVGLFASSFLAATLLPLGSEALLIALALKTDHSLILLWSVATFGNTLGSSATYYLGFLGKSHWIGLKDKEHKRSLHLIQRYGAWAGFLAWVPLIGDPLVLVMGLLRTKASLSHFCFFLGKGIRYFLIIRVL